MKKLQVIILLPLLLQISCSLQKEVSTTHISEVKSVKSDDAIIYALPRTKLILTVETTQIIEKRGPYAEYATQYLGIENIVLKDDEKWLVSDIEIKSLQEIDPNQYYLAEGMSKDDMGLLKLSKEGLILPFAGEKAIGEVFPYCIAFEKDGWNEDIVDFEEVPYLEKQIKQKTQEKKADEIANFIYRLRKRRFKLLASIEEQKAPAGEAFEVNLRELDKLERQYVSLFAGKTISRNQSTCFEFLPDENNVQKPNVLFRFSTYQGILPQSNLTGEPVYIQLLKTDKVKSLRQFLFQQTQTEDDRVGRVFYRIPEETEIRIFDNTKRLFTQKTLVSQYGVISNIPVRFFK